MIYDKAFSITYYFLVLLPPVNATSYNHLVTKDLFI